VVEDLLKNWNRLTKNHSRINPPIIRNNQTKIEFGIKFSKNRISKKGRTNSNWGSINNKKIIPKTIPIKPIIEEKQP
jgi:hypothetical protein